MHMALVEYVAGKIVAESYLQIGREPSIGLAYERFRVGKGMLQSDGEPGLKVLRKVFLIV